MIMPVETIIEIYKESVERGDPVKQIRSLAKANEVKASKIVEVLEDAGLEVPEYILRKPGPRKQDTTHIPEMAAPREPEEETDHRELPMPEAVQEALLQKLDEIDTAIKQCHEHIQVLEAKYTAITKYMGI